MKTGYVYIMSNKLRTVLYIGVTNSIERRILEHKAGVGSRFCNRFQCYELLYYEDFLDITGAIEREKQMKKWNKAWKVELIKTINPDMVDLAMDWYTEKQILELKNITVW